MKKLKLNSNAFNKGEVLTRSQLKSVMGGNGSGTGSGTGNPNCGGSTLIETYYCCYGGGYYLLGDMTCDQASWRCNDGYRVTIDPARCLG